MSAQAVTAFDERIVEVLNASHTPILAAVWSDHSETGELVVHVADAQRRTATKREILSSLRDVGVGRAKVRFHSASRLLRTGSLEQLINRFAGERVAFDPTGSIGRARALVQAAKAVRSSLSHNLRGLFYSARTRSLYVTLEAGRVANGNKFKVADLASIERAVSTAMAASFGAQLSECPAVRLGFGLPSGQLVPVDQLSVIGWPVRLAQAVRRYWKPVTIAAVFGFGMAAGASAKEPAVSQTNFKMTGTAGTINDDTGDGESAWFINGALTSPLGESTGVQLEGGIAEIDGDTIYGFAGHLFTRDPDQYLLGIFAAYASENDFDLDATRLGAEAELYLSQVSLLAKIGYQFSDSVGDGAFGDVEVRWYISDNFTLSGGGVFDETSSFARAGVEWQPGFSALPGLAFRVDGTWGDDDQESILGGLTYYFGAPASLKDRHRKQDPDSALFSLFQSVQQQRNALCGGYGQPPC